MEGLADLPLSGVKVLDLTWLLPGPFGTMMLSELGAEVTKVERPGSGDYLRDMQPRSFEVVNRGKRSIVLDLLQLEGRQVLHALVANADVVVEGFRPGVARRLGADAETLRATKPTLIHASVSGYGQTGPYVQRPGHDVNYAAVTGVLDVPGEWGQPPRRSGLPVADIAGGVYLALNVMAALRRRDVTGTGASIDISLAEGVLHWAQLRLVGSPDLTGKPWAHLHPGNNVFRTADGRGLSLAVIEPKFWAAFCDAAGRSDLLQRYPDPDAITHDPERALQLHAEMAALIEMRGLQEWVSALEPTDVPFAPVNNAHEVAADPHFAARCAVVTNMPGGRIAVPLPGGLGGGIGSPAPAMGAQTAEILAGIGISAGEQARLRQAAVIG